jgi:hypothetical protein
MPARIEPNVSASIPAYLVPEYVDYWRQWYGRRDAAQEKDYDA